MWNLPLSWGSPMLTKQFAWRIRHTERMRRIQSTIFAMNFLSTCQDQPWSKLRSSKLTIYLGNWLRESLGTRKSTLSSVTSWRDGIYTRRNRLSWGICIHNTAWGLREGFKPLLISSKRRNGWILLPIQLLLLLSISISCESLSGKLMIASLRT